MIGDETMIIEFSKGLHKEKIFGQGNELVSILAHDTDADGKRILTLPNNKKEHIITFDNPVLVTDNYKIGCLDSTLRDTIFALFKSPTVTVKYDGTVIDFEQRKYPQVWGPSIDTLYLAEILTQEYLSDVNTAAESGSGSAFLSMRLLQNAKNLETLSVIDTNKYAIRCAKDHINDERVKFSNSDAIKYLKGKKFDLIICNPPYILRPESIDDNAYEGVSMLAYLIKNTASLVNDGGRILTNISTLADSVINPLLEESGTIHKVLREKYVPLKVFNVLNNKKWMDYLLSEKGLKKDPHDGYDYWHTIKITELRAA